MEGEALENLWFEARYRNLPPVAEEQLRLASQSYADNAKAEMHLTLARAIAPDHPVVMVGEYRYYFYKNRLPEALKVAERCLKCVAAELRIPPRWQDVMPRHSDFLSDDATHRFYLFVLKAYAYLLLRLNFIVEGAVAAEKLLELDPRNKVGGQVLRDVLDRVGKDDYDD
jgi:hypothetical protein